MDWITKRYDQFFLAVSVSALMVCAGLICLRMQSFGTHFGSATMFVPKDAGEALLRTTGVPTEPLVTGRTKFSTLPAVPVKAALG